MHTSYDYITLRFSIVLKGKVSGVQIMALTLGQGFKRRWFDISPRSPRRLKGVCPRRISWDFLHRAGFVSFHIKSLWVFLCLHSNCKLSITLNTMCKLLFTSATLGTALQKFCLRNVRYWGATHKKNVWVRVNVREATWTRL